MFRIVGKLKLRYVKPFEILERVVVLAYHFVLPPNLSGVHNVFYVSMLKKYVCNEGHIIKNFTQLEIQHDALHVEKLIKILGREEKVSRRKIIHLEQVLLHNHGVEEYTSKLRKIQEKDILICLSCNNVPLLE